MRDKVRNLEIKNNVKGLGNKLGVWGIVLALFVILSVTTGESFLTQSNLINVVRNICVTGVVAIGATFVICGGEIDLSPGALAALAGCGSATLIVHMGMNIWLAIFLTLVGGAFAGLVVGLVVTRFKVQAFITTLGAQYVLNGLVLLLTRGTPITGLPDAYVQIGRGYVGAVPVPTIILLVLTVIAAFVFKYTSFGRNTLAVGENSTAARLSGISVNMIKISVFAVSGALSALGGIMLTARLSSGQPTAAADLSLQAMAAVFVGGTTSNGSQNGMLGTLAGALFIGLMNNGLNLLQVNSYWQKVILGVIIVAAVAFDTYRVNAASKK